MKKTSGSRKVSTFHSSSHRDLSPAEHRRSSRSRSWNHRASWNRNVCDVPNEGDSSWPPLIAHVPESKTAILKNKDSKRKREKKRKTESLQKKQKRKRIDKQSSSALPSEQVFACGVDILGSVSFSKDKPQPPQQKMIDAVPPTKDQIFSKKTSERDGSKHSRRNTREAPRKQRRVVIKPVAITDLDNSPSKKVRPSPTAVIILSDSDHENDKSQKTPSHSHSMASNATESISHDKPHSSIVYRESNIKVLSPPLSSTAVIVLSDSDHENDKSQKTRSTWPHPYLMASNTTERISNDKHHSSIDNHSNILVLLPPLSPTPESLSPTAVIILSHSDHENDRSQKTPSHSPSIASNATERISNDKSSLYNLLHHDNDDDEKEDESTQISGYAELNEEQLRLLDGVPRSAVELRVSFFI